MHHLFTIHPRLGWQVYRLHDWSGCPPYGLGWSTHTIQTKPYGMAVEPPLSIRVYNTCHPPSPTTLLLIAQILNLSRAALEAEPVARKHIALGPPKWCSMEDLAHLNKSCPAQS